MTNIYDISLIYSKSITIGLGKICGHHSHPNLLLGIKITPVILWFHKVP
jgi:hypothetical protein